MCNDCHNHLPHSCPSCGSLGFAGPLMPLDTGYLGDSLCAELADLVRHAHQPTNSCLLKAAVGSVTKGPDGFFSITISVTGNTGPVEVSLNRRLYLPGTSVSGASGQAVVVYVREQYQPSCETAVLVKLEAGLCVPPSKPVVTITDATCVSGSTGSIGLASQPAGVFVHWYANLSGTGVASLNPPAYDPTRSISGSVRFGRPDDPQCLSELTTFTTHPAVCGCVALDFGGTSLPNAVVGVFYARRIALTGTAPFGLGAVSKPLWMSVTIQDRELVLSGTPVVADITGSATVSVEVINCSTSRKTLSATMGVLSSCAQVESDWEIIGSHCRICDPIPVLRVAAIRCKDPAAPATSPCANSSPSYKVAAIACVSSQVTTGNPCAGVTPSLKIVDIRCGTGAIPTADPCAGVSASYKVTDIHCQTS